MNNFILAQIFGALGAFGMLLSSWQKTRKRILIFLIFDCIFYMIEYMLLSAYSGVVTNGIGILRSIVFIKKGSNEFFKTKYPLLILIFLCIIVNIFTYDGITSLFPCIASIIYTIVLWQNQPKKIRIGSSIMLAMWCIYNIIVEAYVGAIVEGTLFISSVIAIIKIDFNKK